MKVFTIYEFVLYESIHGKPYTNPSYMKVFMVNHIQIRPI